MPVKLKYETGIATTIQFIVITILNFIGGVTSSISQCTTNSSNCAGDIILAILYFLVISICFAALWIIGMAAQDKRSKRLCKFLIIGEFIVFALSSYDLTHNDSIANKISSFVDVFLSVWIISLAYRLLRAKGGRVRPRNRVRRSSEHQS